MGIMSPNIKEYIRREAGAIDGPLLDIGCGNLPYRDLFPHVKSYVATDIHDERYKMSAYKNVDFIRADAVNFPFEDNSFNGILAAQLLEHLADPEVFLKEVFRVLKVQGKALITLPLVAPLHEEPHDYWRFTEYGVKHLCNKADLHICKIIPMGGAWLTVGFILNHILSKRVEERKSPAVKYLYSCLNGFIFSRLTRLDKRWQVPELPWNYLIIVQKTD